MHSHKILHLARRNPILSERLGKAFALSPVVAQVLINRGIKTVDEARRFLQSRLEDLHDPYTLGDMSEAVRLIQQAQAAKQKVMVCGDYDVDGLTALVLLKQSLARLGIEVLHYLPHRIQDGYGLNKHILRLAREQRVGLVITADCGISDTEHIRDLRQHGIEVIITDHHEPANHELPPASAIINPKVKNSRYPYRDLAGVGVAYKLCQAFTRSPLADELDLVSLGTIADVVPLTGENRIIVREGLSRLNGTKRAGLRALMQTSGIQHKKITSGSVSFILAPRINASGRMDTAEVALHLLLSESDEEALRLAQTVETYNRQRQKIEAKILEEAEALIAKEINFKEHKVIVLAGENWHQGVLGIVASKLAERFHRPTIVISLGKELCKGSGRSINNFHLFEALLECKDVLHSFGGHSHAAGLVIHAGHLKAFRERINRLAIEKLRIDDLLPSIEVDMELALSQVDPGMVSGLELLEPFGTGNPEPLFYTRDLRLKGDCQQLQKNTLKFWVTDGRDTLPAIGFGWASCRDSLTNAKKFDLVYTPRIDAWQGEEHVILEIEDMFFQ